MSFFAFPETRWHRHRANDIQTKTRHPSSTSLATNPEMNGKTSPPNLENGVADQPYTPVQTPIQHGKPGRKQFNLFQPNQQPLKTLLVELWTPFKLFAFPIVDFASLVVAWSTASFLIVNLTQSQAFSESPYQYTAQTVGFFNFAVVVGLLLGLGTAGPLNDWISMRATKRNKGIREPEMRLPAMIPYTLIMILGNFVVGFGYQYHWDWKVRRLPSLLPLTWRFLQLCWRKRQFLVLISMFSTSGNRHCRLHLRRHPSSINPSHCFHLRH